MNIIHHNGFKSPHSHQRKGLEPKGSSPFAFPKSLWGL